MDGLLSEFDQLPKERELIGEMLLAYGEFEFVLIGLIHDALPVDMSTAARLLFRINGEHARLQVADAILRPTFAKHNLKDKWITAHGAVKHCKNLRNQYAHCHWQLHQNKLHFLDLDGEARLPAENPTMNITFLPIDLPLILRQHQYFVYAIGQLYYVRDRLRRSMGLLKDDDPFPEPKSIPQPPRDSRPDKDVPSPEAGGT